MFEISKQTFATSTAMDLGKESQYPAVRKPNTSTSLTAHRSISSGRAANPKEKILEVKVNDTIN